MTAIIGRDAEARHQLLRVTAAFCAHAAVLMLVLAWMDPGLPWPPSTWRASDIAYLTLNAVPALVLSLFLLALTRRLILASWLVLLVLWALYAVNAAKLTHLQTPLLPSDFLVAVTSWPAIRLLSSYLRFDGLTWAALLAVVGITIALYKAAGDRVLRRRSQLALGIATCLLSISLVRGSAPWPWLYDGGRLGFQPWSVVESTQRVGLLGALLLYQWEYRARDVPPADTEAAANLLQAHAPALAKRWAMGAVDELPDIVVVQSESFFDPSRLRGIPHGVPLKAFNELAKSALAGNLRVPAFGGGTIRTEFEVLTGVPLDGLDGVQYPWLELGKRDLFALPKLLARYGYRTLAVHPNAGAFWNRASTYPELGFEKFIDGAEFSDDSIHGLFTSDAALTDRILAELDADERPQFIFAVSMEAHGPFDWRPGLDADRLSSQPVPEALDEGGRFWLRNYLYLNEDADRELGRLAAALAQRSRRTLLLFYGDHLPALPPVYAQLGFDDEAPPESQPVPWLLFDTAARHPRRLDTHAWLLPSLLLEAAGLHDASYFSAMDVLREELDLDHAGDEAEDRDGIIALARLALTGRLDELLNEVAATADAG